MHSLLCNYYWFWNKTGKKVGNFKFFKNFILFFIQFENSFFFYKMIILMGIIWIIKKVINFILKRGQNSEISCILKVYIIFRFFIKIFYVFLIDFAENFPLYVDRFPPSHRVKQIKLLDQMGQIPKFGSFIFHPTLIIVLQNTQD